MSSAKLPNLFTSEAVDAVVGAIALVAERCATILEIEADADPQDGARSAANTIRAAFIDAPQQLKPAARAAASHALSLANRRTDH